MQPAPFVAERLRDRVHERRDVVLRALLELPHTFRCRNPRPLANLARRLRRHDPELGPRVERGELHLEPAFELALLRPDPGHRRTGVAVDHAVSLALRQAGQPVASLRNGRADQARVDALAVLDPAVLLVEASRPRVFGRDPEHGLVPPLREPSDGRLHQREPRARPLKVRGDVDREQLARARRIPASADAGEADDALLALGDEDVEPVGRGEPAPHALAFLHVERVEHVRAHNVEVGRAPRLHLHVGDRPRVVVGGTADLKAHASRIRAARAAAFCPLSTPTVATGTPGGSCEIASSASRPSSTLRLDRSGTPITGKSVCAATTPGRAAERPAPQMSTLRPRSRAVRAYSATESGVRWAERTSNSQPIPRSLSSSVAGCMRSRSESATTTVTAASSAPLNEADPRSPAAAPASAPRKSPSSRGRIAWVSGSPNRQLNSSTR